MPADSLVHAFTLSPTLPRQGGGSRLVAALQDVVIYKKLNNKLVFDTLDYTIGIIDIDIKTQAQSTKHIST